MTDATLVTSSEVGTIVMRAWRDRDSKSHGIAQFGTSALGETRTRVGRGPRGPRHEVWSLKDLRTQQVKTMAANYNIKGTDELQCVLGARCILGSAEHCGD